eukprot:365538-Chlamydomonas_euryale.AAC.9
MQRQHQIAQRLGVHRPSNLRIVRAVGHCRRRQRRQRSGQIGPPRWRGLQHKAGFLRHKHRRLHLGSKDMQCCGQLGPPRPCQNQPHILTRKRFETREEGGTGVDDGRKPNQPLASPAQL